MTEQEITEVAPRVNWSLIQDLTARPHKHLNIADDFDAQLASIPSSWVAEVFQEARTVHHLLDLAGVPEGKGDSAHVDARAYLLVAEVGRLRDLLARVAGWHSRETAEGGMVGDFCNECGTRWPCETRRLIDPP